jgi:tetratricopeptide (TPR) repeat protein
MEAVRFARRRRPLRTFFILLFSLMLTDRAASSAAAPAASGQELLRQGTAALQAGQTELAIAKYKAALQAAPQEPAKRGQIEFVLGIAYQKAQLWQESVDALNAATRDNGNLGYLPYSLLGFSYQRLGRWQEETNQKRCHWRAGSSSVALLLGSFRTDWGMELNLF